VYTSVANSLQNLSASSVENSAVEEKNAVPQ
jgi:hypothetical protein